jgi:hypothetical protein
MMMFTDVIVPKPTPQDVRAEIQAIGLNYLREGTQDDFRRWMEVYSTQSRCSFRG